MGLLSKLTNRNKKADISEDVILADGTTQEEFEQLALNSITPDMESQTNSATELENRDDELNTSISLIKQRVKSIKMSKKELVSKVNEKYAELINGYSSFINSLYSLSHFGTVEDHQKDVYENKIQKMYKRLFDKNGNVVQDEEQLKKFANLKLSVGYGYIRAHEYTREADTNGIKMEYRQLKNFVAETNRLGNPNVIKLPNNALVVSFTLNLNNGAQVETLARVNIYLYNNTLYNKGASMKKYLSTHPKRAEKENASFAYNTNIFYYSPNKFKIIHDELKAGNTIEKGMYKSELKARFAFVNNLSADQAE